MWNGMRFILLMRFGGICHAHLIDCFKVCRCLWCFDIRSQYRYVSFSKKKYIYSNENKKLNNLILNFCFQGNTARRISTNASNHPPPVRTEERALTSKDPICAFVSTAGQVRIAAITSTTVKILYASTAERVTIGSDTTTANVHQEKQVSLSPVTTVVPL